MDVAAQVIRAIHIAAAMVALLTFAIPLVVQKGGAVHRKVGLAYVWAMYVAAATAVLIAPIRMLQRPVNAWGSSIFLAYVAVLSFAAAFFGMRVLEQKKRTGPLLEPLGLLVPAVLGLLGVMMVLWGVTDRGALAIVFGSLGVLVSVTQLRVLRRAPSDKRWWLREHLGAMFISTIATLTAFAVNNTPERFRAYSLVFWLTPTVVLTPLSIYWGRLYATPRGKVAPGVAIE